MKHLIPSSLLAIAFAQSGSAVTVVSQVVEDGWLFNGTNRNEHILNNTGSNTGRWGIARFDAVILGAQDFTDPSQFTLTSATLTLTEEAGRNSNNGSQSGRVGAYFVNTAENSGWTSSNLSTFSWHGNSGGRPGNVGGGTTGNNNVDERSNGSAPLTVGLTSPAPAGDGSSFVAHTHSVANTAETATVDLTQGGATLSDIQSLLADWVAGNNAGLILAGEFGNQSFWQSNGVASGSSVGSTIDGDATDSGNSLEAGGGNASGGLFLTLEFEPVTVPEPSSALLAGLGSLALFRRRR